MPLRTSLHRMDWPKPNFQRIHSPKDPPKPAFDSPKTAFDSPKPAFHSQRLDSPRKRLERMHSNLQPKHPPSSSSLKQSKSAADLTQLSSDANIPSSFLCPISLCLMEDPVTLPSGITYDRSSVQKWLRDGKRTCPVTMSVIGSDPPLIPNRALRAMILDWQSRQTHTPASAVPLLRSMVECIARGPPHRLPSLRRIQNMLKSGEISPVTAQDEGLVAALIAVVSGGEQEAAARDAEAMEAEEEAMATLALVRVGREDMAVLAGTGRAMGAVGRLMRKGRGEEGAAMVERMAREGEVREGGEEVVRGLVAMVVEGGRWVREAVAAMAAMVMEGRMKEAVVREVVAAEAMAALIELLAGAPRSTAEKLLALISTACSLSHHARSAVSAHALAVPVLVRSLLVYSDLANDLAISTLWSLICTPSSAHSQPQQLQSPQHQRQQQHKRPLEDDNDSPALQASQAGAAQKLLVVAQMDCTPHTKRRITDLLKHDHQCPQSHLLHYDSSQQQLLLR